MRCIDNFRLGETPDVVEVALSDEARDAALALVRQARRTVDIVSRHLDAPLYDTAEFVAAVKALALGSHQARIRIVLGNVEPVLRDGHRLVTLAQRLPTFIQIRVPAPQFRDFNPAFLVADETGFLHRQFSDRYEGSASFFAPATARELLRVFEPIWETAEPDPNLRALRI